MSKYKDEIAKRSKLTSYLEYVYVNKAVETFLKNKNDIFTIENFVDSKWYGYASSFTRNWLNYMSNKQFNKIVEKKTKDKVAPRFLKGNKYK